MINDNSEILLKYMHLDLKWFCCFFFMIRCCIFVILNVACDDFNLVSFGIIYFRDYIEEECSFEQTQHGFFCSWKQLRQVVTVLCYGRNHSERRVNFLSFIIWNFSVNQDRFTRSINNILSTRIHERWCRYTAIY